MQSILITVYECNGDTVSFSLSFKNEISYHLYSKRFTLGHSSADRIRLAKVNVGLEYHKKNFSQQLFSAHFMQLQMSCQFKLQDRCVFVSSAHPSGAALPACVYYTANQKQSNHYPHNILARFMLRAYAVLLCIFL